MNREKLRELLVEAGLDILKQEGLGTGAERLTFKRVFDHLYKRRQIRVTNASVIKRIWLNNEEYQTDVLAEAVRDENQVELDAAILEAIAVVEAADLTSNTGRTDALHELCRRAGTTYALLLSKSKTWHLFLGIWGNVASRPKNQWDRRVTRAAQLTYNNVTARLADVFRLFMDLLGMRLRPGYTLEQCASAVIALADGCAIRDRLDPAATRKIMIDSPTNQESQEWWLFAIGLEALVWHFMELELDWPG